MADEILTSDVVKLATLYFNAQEANKTPIDALAITADFLSGALSPQQWVRQLMALNYTPEAITTWLKEQFAAM